MDVLDALITTPAAVDDGRPGTSSLIPVPGTCEEQPYITCLLEYFEVYDYSLAQRLLKGSIVRTRAKAVRRANSTAFAGSKA